MFGSVEMKLQSGKWYSTLYKLHPFLNSGKQSAQEMESCCELFVGTDLVIGLTKCEYSIITKPGELERRAGADRSDLSDRNAASLYHSTSRATNISCANYAPLSMDQLGPNIIHSANQPPCFAVASIPSITPSQV